MLSDKDTRNLYSIVEVVFILGKKRYVSNPSELGPQSVVIFCIVDFCVLQSGDRIKVFLIL